jgi:hypothetical protein
MALIFVAGLGFLAVFTVFGFFAEWHRTKKFPSDGVPIVLIFWALFIAGLFAFI